VTPRNCRDPGCVLCADGESLNVHPPPLDGGDGAKMFMRSPLPEVGQPHSRRDAGRGRARARAQVGREGARGPQQHAYDLARQRVEQAIGASEGLRGPFGRISFKANKKGVRTLLTTWTGGPKP
jgi:hypothetical protein